MNDNFLTLEAFGYRIRLWSEVCFEFSDRALLHSAEHALWVVWLLFCWGGSVDASGGHRAAQKGSATELFCGLAVHLVFMDVGVSRNPSESTDVPSK